MLSTTQLATSNEPSVPTANTTHESHSVLPDAIQVTGSRTVVSGTNADDVIIWRLHEYTDSPLRHRVTINGESHLLPAGIRRIEFQGNGGNDTFSGFAGSTNDRAKLASDLTTILGQDYSIAAEGFANVFIDGGNGIDQAEMIGSSQPDRYVARYDSSRLTSLDFRLVAKHFEKVDARGGEGRDTAIHFDGPYQDLFSANATRTFMRDRQLNYENRGWDFEDVTAISATPSSLWTGQDVAYVYDRPSDDLFVAKRQSARLSSADGEFSTRVNGFTEIHAYASSGNDRAVLFDRNEASDLVAIRPTTVRITGSLQFSSVAHGFDQVSVVTSDNAFDRAMVFDSPGNDTLIAHPRRVTVIPEDGTITKVSNINLVRAASQSGGHDALHLYGGDGEDRFVAEPDRVTMRSVAGPETRNGYQVRTKGFKRIIAYADDRTFDAAVFYDGPGTEEVIMSGDFTRIFDINSEYLVELKLFSRVFVQLGTPSELNGTSADLATILSDTDSEVVEGPTRTVLRSLDGGFSGNIAGETFLTIEATGP